MSRRRPNKPVEAFPSARRAFDLRKATSGEWRVAGLVLVTVATLLGSLTPGLMTLGVYVAVAGGVSCGLLLIVKLVARRPEPARGAFLLGVALAAGFALGIWIGRMRHAETFRRGDEIVAALRRYAAREGRYPDSLGDLVPADLDSVPEADVGLFSRRPFRYRPRGRDFRLSFAARGWSPHETRTNIQPWYR